MDHLKQIKMFLFKDFAYFWESYELRDAETDTAGEMSERWRRKRGTERKQIYCREATEVWMLKGFLGGYSFSGLCLSHYQRHMGSNVDNICVLDEWSESHALKAAALLLTITCASFTHSERVSAGVWARRCFWCRVADKSDHCRSAHSLCTTVSCDTLPPTPAGLLGTLVISRYCA